VKGKVCVFPSSSTQYGDSEESRTSRGLVPPSRLNLLMLGLLTTSSCLHFYNQDPRSVSNGCVYGSTLFTLSFGG
jgi:hypothetical protein